MLSKVKHSRRNTVPVSAPKLCPCGTIFEGARCPSCFKEQNKQYTRYVRDTTNYDEVYNTTQWRLVRDLAFKRDKGVCAMCQAKGRYTPAVIADHIIEIDDGGAKFELNNIQILCRSCHNIKTAEAKKTRS